MPSQINASNSGFGGIVSTGDSSGVLQLQAAGTTIATIQSTGLNLSSNGLVFSDSSTQTAAASPFGLKNRIINGDMVIDQRNNGASGTSSGYTVDRWGYYQTQTSKGTWQRNAGSVTPPLGFSNYLGFTSSSAYSILTTDQFIFYQGIEGFNIADLAWGTANARTVTLSFWVRSSLTGTFGGSLQNSAFNRSYPFSYTISSANTWEQKSVTISGDTSGTWLTNNSAGIYLNFSLGMGSSVSSTAGTWAAGNFQSATGAVSVVGTNGATFYITGVQLERNTTATPFEWIPYGQELMLCQRYYETNKNDPNGYWYSIRNDGIARGLLQFIVEKRAAPTVTLTNQVNATWALGSSLGTGRFTCDWGRGANFSSFGTYEATAEL